MDGSYFPSLFAFLQNGGDREVAIESVRHDAVKFNNYIGRRVREIQRSGDTKERDKLVQYIKVFGHGLKAFSMTYSVKDEKLDWVLTSISIYHHVLTAMLKNPDRMPGSGVLMGLRRQLSS
jgi:hypothetical protein